MYLNKKIRAVYNKLCDTFGYRITRNVKFVGGAPELSTQHTQHCVLLPNRNVMLDLLPKHAVVGEVGIEYGDFSVKIINQTQPKKLYLFDISSQSTHFVAHREDLAQYIANNTIEITTGNSAAKLATFKDNTFDWLYIDGDHSYDAVKKDLTHALRIVKDDGIIVVNDYTPIDNIGVINATNEFCIEHNCEFIYFCLQYQMYCDVAIRKIKQ